MLLVQGNSVDSVSVIFCPPFLILQINKTHRKSINLFNDLWSVFENCVALCAFLWKCPKSFVYECICVSLIFWITSCLELYIYWKWTLHTNITLFTITYLNKKMLIWPSNLRHPTTHVTEAWICSSLQTHEIVYYLWNSFHQSSVNPQRKIILYFLKLKLCSLYLHNKKES